VSEWLYIDLPFKGEKGGDKARSRFIWETLNRNYDVDLFLVSSGNPSTEIAQRHGIRTDLQTGFLQPGKWLSPRSIYTFPAHTVESYEDLLNEKQYTSVFFRFIAPTRLMRSVKRILPHARIVVDVDMLQSRVAELSWSSKRSLKNRYYLLEYMKLRHYEKKLFSSPYLFLFSNPIERSLIYERCSTVHSGRKLEVLPNVLPASEKKTASLHRPHTILFFGTLNSAANEDAFRYLATSIYPRVESTLKEKGFEIHVVGKHPTPLYAELAKDRPLLHVIGEVEDIDQAIADSLFCILPLRIASGTRTRILEIAQQNKAVITTTIGAEGLGFSSKELLIGDTSKIIAEHISSLMGDRQMSHSIGTRLKQRADEMYSRAKIEEHLVTTLDEYRQLTVAPRDIRCMREKG